jgi:hypothetical protein
LNCVPYFAAFTPIEAFSPSTNVLTCTLHPLNPYHSYLLQASEYHTDH